MTATKFFLSESSAAERLVGDRHEEKMKNKFEGGGESKFRIDGTYKRTGILLQL